MGGAGVHANGTILAGMSSLCVSKVEICHMGTHTFEECLLKDLAGVLLTFSVYRLNFLAVPLWIRESISDKIYVLEANCDFQKHLPVWVSGQAIWWFLACHVDASSSSTL